MFPRTVSTYQTARWATIGRTHFFIPHLLEVAHTGQSSFRNSLFRFFNLHMLRTRYLVLTAGTPETSPTTVIRPVNNTAYAWCNRKAESGSFPQKWPKKMKKCESPNSTSKVYPCVQSGRPSRLREKVKASNCHFGTVPRTWDPGDRNRVWECQMLTGTRLQHFVCPLPEPQPHSV
jgi:hypothetical protein